MNNNIKCPKCGHEDNSLAAKKCEYCGTKLKGAILPKSPNLTKINFLGIIGLFIVLLLLGPLGIKYYEFINKPRLKADVIRFGILSKPENYETLRQYLEKNVIPDDFFNFLFHQGKQINFTINGNQDLSYQEAKEKIRNKDWDIAYTLSPALSIAAKDNGYTFVAQMFPGKNLYYRSAIYVRHDSSIKSLSDLNSKTLIALGDLNSTSSFYVPVYDLYGRTLNIKVGVRGVHEKVKNGEVDVGAGVASNVEKDPDLRIIHSSRDIPGAGVYISPNISEKDQKEIQKILLQAPNEIKQIANYGTGKEADYTEFIKIRKRVDEVLSCANFNQNPVNLFCLSQSGIAGHVNGVSILDSTTNRLLITGDNGHIYTVIVSHFLLPNPNTIQGKPIHIIGVEPKHIDDSTYEIIITKPEQLIFKDE